MKIPCDCLLLNGDCIMNEASLTGETLPIPKQSIQNSLDNFSLVKNKKNILFEGTKVLKLKPWQNQENLYAMALRTGFSTSKGQIFRQILFPKFELYEFARTVFKFFFILYGVLNVLFIPVIFIAENEGFSAGTIFFIMYISMMLNCFPPVLMIFVNFNTTAAFLRLKHRKITCIDSTKIIPAAKVDK